MGSTEEAVFVPTRGSLRKGGVSHDVVVFETPKPKKTSQEPKPNKSNTNHRENVIDMKRTRFEIYKFAKGKLSADNKQTSKVELALKLGAKPKKKKGINYKQLLIENQVKKVEAEADASLRRLGKKPSDDKSSLRNKRKVASGILKSYGKVSRKVKK